MARINLFALSFLFFICKGIICLKTQPGTEAEGMCPTSVDKLCRTVDQLSRTVDQLSRTIDQLRRNLTQQANAKVPECGPGDWVQVARLNMSDPDQNCPTPWVTTTNPSRSCAAANPPCASVYYDTLNTAYQRVCGKALGYATTSPDGFKRFRSSGINGAYLDGVSITYGQPRQHIWSLAAGHDNSVYSIYRCPCDNPNRRQAPLPPAFVGDNYFCDSDHVNAPVWDGEGCTTSCCSFHSPPWFVATLPSQTADQIEVRICHDQSAADERIHIAELLLYVQ